MKRPEKGVEVMVVRGRVTNGRNAQLERTASFASE